MLLCMRHSQTTLQHGGHVHILALGAKQADANAKSGNAIWHLRSRTVFMMLLQRLAARPGLLLLMRAPAMTPNEVDVSFSFVLCVL